MGPYVLLASPHLSHRCLSPPSPVTLSSPHPTLPYAIHLHILPAFHPSSLPCSTNPIFICHGNLHACLWALSNLFMPSRTCHSATYTRQWLPIAAGRVVTSACQSRPLCTPVCLPSWPCPSPRSASPSHKVASFPPRPPPPNGALLCSSVCCQGVLFPSSWPSKGLPVLPIPGQWCFLREATPDLLDQITSPWGPQSQCPHLPFPALLPFP